ncbi:MAG TPA: hypothetical protein VLD18_01285 [Verrucomicrobiae bacterium]|nr:hypothetical protein [Verrucomicrobiae bacterium]
MNEPIGSVPVLIPDTQSMTFAELRRVAGRSILVSFGVLLRLAHPIQRIIGDAGASIVSCVVGLIRASVAPNNVREGITQYFDLGD